LKGEKAITPRFRQRFAKAFLDMLVLRMLQEQPLWGYKIISQIHKNYEVKVGYGIMYPLLNSLEKEGFIKSRLEFRGKRKRKVYEVTPKGANLIKEYHNFLKEQLQMLGAPS